jgi:outer membrane protein assembly factor BamB
MRNRIRRLTLAAVAVACVVGGRSARAQVLTITPLPTPTPSSAPVVRPRPRPKPPVVPEKPVFRRPRPLWKTFLHRVEGTPAIDDRSAFVAGDTSVYEIDNGGRTLWETPVGLMHGSPALDDTRVYIGTNPGSVFALDRSTGSAVWQTPVAAGTILTQPAVSGGLVAVESTDNYIYALDATSGHVNWKFERPDGSLGYSAPVFDADGKRLYDCGETTLYCLNPANGHERWHSYIGGKSSSTPEVAEGRVFVGGDGTGLSAFAADSGSLAWSFKGDRADDWFGAPLAADGAVFVGTYERYVYAIDAATGKMRWSYRLGGSALARPAFDSRRSVLYVTSSAATTSDEPTLSAFDTKTGKLLASFHIGPVTGGPAVERDRLTVGSTAGFFYAFSLE